MNYCSKYCYVLKKSRYKYDVKNDRCRIKISYAAEIRKKFNYPFYQGNKSLESTCLSAFGYTSNWLPRLGVVSELAKASAFHS